MEFFILARRLFLLSAPILLLTGLAVAGALESPAGSQVSRDSIGTATGFAESPRGSIVFGHIGEFGAASILSDNGVEIRGGIPGAAFGGFPTNTTSSLLVFH